MRPPRDNPRTGPPSEVHQIKEEMLKIIAISQRIGCSPCYADDEIWWFETPNVFNKVHQHLGMCCEFSFSSIINIPWNPYIRFRFIVLFELYSAKPKGEPLRCITSLLLIENFEDFRSFPSAVIRRFTLVITFSTTRGSYKRLSVKVLPR